MVQILFLITALLTSISFAQETSQATFYKFSYVMEQDGTLLDALKAFKLNKKKLTTKNASYKRTVEENPQISDWNSLKKGTKLSLFLKINQLDKEKYRRYIKKSPPSSETISSSRPSGVRGSIFYMASYGKFTQKKSPATINFYQNSPISIGTAWSFYPPDTNWSISTSGYLSYLLVSGSNLENQKVAAPLELGTNIYGEYRFSSFTGYFGWDYERFSVFNMEQLLNDAKLRLNKVHVHYATIGFSRMFSLFNSPFFTKLSLSKSLFTYTDETPDSYSGYKAMWYLNKKIGKDLFIHSLLKYHWMNGDSDLETLRIGLGVGYIL